jgi:hypothetical protein
MGDYVSFFYPITFIPGVINESYDKSKRLDHLHPNISILKVAMKRNRIRKIGIPYTILSILIAIYIGYIKKLKRLFTYV